MNNLVKKLWNFLFPTKCVGCGLEGCSICGKCLRSVAPAEKPKEDWIISVWSYKDFRIKRLLWFLKFHRRFAVAEDLSQTLHDHLIDELSEKAVFENMHDFLLIPIPLFPKKLRERGYNQSFILAKEICRRGKGEFEISDNILEKIKDGPPQNSIKNRAKRFQNARGNLAVKHPEKVVGRNIVIIDDITTTHATLLEAKRVLKKAGAKNVLAFTVAH